MTTIEIRLLQESDIDSINELYKRSYGLERTKEKFAWEFIQGPAGPAIYIVALKDSTIIGTQCAIPLYLKSPEGELILSAKSEDTFVDAAYRGQSIFEKMYELLFEECSKRSIHYLWGFTYAIKPFKKINFEIPFEANFGLIAINLSQSYKLLDSLKAKRPMLEKVKLRLLVTASWTNFKLRSLLVFNSDKQNTTISTNPPSDLNSLLQSENEKNFYLNQDKNFLSWRLLNNPYNEHVYYSLKDLDGKLIGNIVCSIHDKKVAYIMQLAFAKNLSQSARLLFVSYVLRQLSKKEVLIRYWGFENTNEGISEIALLKQAGVTFTKRGISFVWKEMAQSFPVRPEDFRLSRLASQSSF
jgi:hypothetical protein